MKKIIAFAGSNSSKSINQQLIKSAAKLVTDVAVEVIDIRTYDAPIYSSDIEEASGQPQSIIDFANRLNEADGIIISTPEHNGSLPAFFKNIIDWSSRVNGKFLGGKPVVLLSTSGGGYGGANALADMEKKLKYFDGRLIAKFSLGSFYDKYDTEKGVISDVDENDKLKLAVESLTKELTFQKV